MENLEKRLLLYNCFFCIDLLAFELSKLCPEGVGILTEKNGGPGSAWGVGRMVTGQIDTRISFTII